MYSHSQDPAEFGEVTIAPEVLEYINKRGCDFRICTSCGGPVLLSTRIKQPKKSDLLLKAGNQMIYVSVHQARFLNTIQMDMIPFFDDDELTRYERG
ncbi:hypothetical protein [Methanoregula sp.]|jgi:hypothetical protein|uniref:hypothetical protein n=1 Tax=Methanoregula sp. TaxID=2052170 RepID=UPI003C212893